MCDHMGFLWNFRHHFMCIFVLRNCSWNCRFIIEKAVVFWLWGKAVLPVIAILVFLNYFISFLDISHCAALSCQYRCHSSPSGGMCYCPAGYTISSNDSRTCIGKWNTVIEISGTFSQLRGKVDTGKLSSKWMVVLANRESLKSAKE